MFSVPEFGRSLFLDGPAGSGKTSAAGQYLARLVQQGGVNPENILILVPHPVLAQPYERVADSLGYPTRPFIATLSGFARTALPFYWNWIKQQSVELAEVAAPIFLTADIAQYHLSRLIQPYLKMGSFNSIRLPTYRVVTQILDSINHATESGLSLAEMQNRLIAGWGQRHSSRLLVYQTVTEIAHQYQTFCLKNGFLDYSLQIHLLTNVLLDNDTFRADFQQQFRCLIVDNIEEMSALTHDFIFWAMENTEKTLILHDHDGGYRVFTGADPVNAVLLRDVCTDTTMVNQPITQSPAMQTITGAAQMLWDSNFPNPANDPITHQQETFQFATHPFYPQMVDHCIQQIKSLVSKHHISPKQIAIVTPFLQDALLLALTSQLQMLGIPCVHYRPSRPLIQEPTVKALISLMKLAYPAVAAPPTPNDMAQVLNTVIDGIDPLRAFLLTQAVYQRQTLSHFDSIAPNLQARITEPIGQRYEILRQWLLEQAVMMNTPDSFLKSLMAEVLSQPGFKDINNSSTIQELVAAAERFTQAEGLLSNPDFVMISEFINFTLNGFITSAESATSERPDAVFIAPVHTYLTRDMVVDYQFWLDIGDSGWYRRIEQPLTHPYVLRRDFPDNTVWTDEMETATQADNLHKLILGLLRRCRKGVFVEACDISANGYEQRGQLLILLERLFNQPSAT